MQGVAAPLVRKLQQDVGKINVTPELGPMSFAGWLNLLLSDGADIKASQCSPDAFGAARFVKTFGMVPGSRWLTRAGAHRVEGLACPRETELPDATSGDAAEAPCHGAGIERTFGRVIVPLADADSILAFSGDAEGVSGSINDLLSLRTIGFADCVHTTSTAGGRGCCRHMVLAGEPVILP